MSEKFCRKCQQNKPEYEFTRNKSTKDGLQAYCRACSREMSKQYTLSGQSKKACKVRYYRNMQNPEYRVKLAAQGRRRTLKCNDLGLCRACGKPSRENRAYCQECCKKIGVRVKNRALAWRENGLCMRCGKLPPLPSNVGKKRPLCETCYIRNLSGSTLKTPKHWKYLQEKLAKQNFRCVYSGKPLILGENASLDHILPVSRFPKKVCEPTNIQWVDLTVNRLKRDLTHSEFINLIEIIYHNIK